MAERAYVVIEPLKYNGEHYRPGYVLQIDDEPVEQALLASGTIGRVFDDGSEAGAVAASDQADGIHDDATRHLGAEEPDPAGGETPAGEGVATDTHDDDDADGSTDGMQAMPGAGTAPGGQDTPSLEAVISSLDPEDDSLWTSSGLPSVSALSARIGRSVAGAERDAAWARVVQARSVYEVSSA